MPKDEVFNPYASPTSSPHDDALPDGDRIGPAWENEGTFLQRFSDTVTGILLRPTETYRNMRRIGKADFARNYIMIGQMIGAFFMYTYQVLLAMAVSNEPVPASAGAVTVFCGTILAPLGALIGLYLGGAIIHLGLIVVGGAKMPMETTYRTLAYMQGSIVMWGIIPIIGGIFALQGIYVGTVGLSEMHGISRGKAFLGLIMPALLMLGLVFAGVMLIGGLAAVSAPQR